MTDLRPLMGLRFECVSVSYSPGLDSKRLHQRKLWGVTEPQQGCSHYGTIYLETSRQSFNVLNKPQVLPLQPEIRALEHQGHKSHTNAHLSRPQDILLRAGFPNCFLVTWSHLEPLVFEKVNRGQSFLCFASLKQKKKKRTRKTKALMSVLLCHVTNFTITNNHNSKVLLSQMYLQIIHVVNLKNLHIFLQSGRACRLQRSQLYKNNPQGFREFLVTQNNFFHLLNSFLSFFLSF